MHGFCTDFARFQNVQRVQIVAKLDKGCRNCWVKNYVALIKNNDNSKLPETETNRRLALLISGSWVRVPDGAPKNALHESVGCFLLLYFKKARSGAPSGILEQGGGTQCRKERHSAAFLSPRESPRWCTRKSRNECCGFFVAPFPSGQTRTSRKRSCSSRGDWSLKMVAGL